jgi:hypothetical protein
MTRKPGPLSTECKLSNSILDVFDKFDKLVDNWKTNLYLIAKKANLLKLKYLTKLANKVADKYCLVDSFFSWIIFYFIKINKIKLKLKMKKKKFKKFISYKLKYYLK